MGRKSHSRNQVEALERRTLLAAHIVGSSTSYSTIQAAVNAASAGATITVDAGSYAELVTVNKSLTIQGAQSGVDARGSVREENNPESIVTGATTSNGVSEAFKIAANDVTIDGFTIQGETVQTVNVSAGVVIAPNVSGTHIINNIIQNNVSGLFLANASSTDAALIQYNLFKGNNNAGANGGRGIYTDDTISGGNLTNVTIDSNAFLNNFGGSGTTGLESAIAFEAGIANAQSNIHITNNVIDGNGKAVLFFNASNVTITGNTITNNQDWYSGALRFEGNDTTFTITNNAAYHNTGPAIGIDSKAAPGSDSAFTITGNSFYDNSTTPGNHISVALSQGNYNGTLNVKSNWWGSSTGPSGDGSGSGDAVYGNAHYVTNQGWAFSTGGTENFSSWATAALGMPTPNFLGATAHANVPIQAEDFNQGGEGIAYHDTDPTVNNGGQYRASGVDIEANSDGNGGYDVGWTAASEFLTYTINVATAGTYRFDLRIANLNSAGDRVHLEIDGVNVTGAIDLPDTGAWNNWLTISSKTFSVTSGKHTIKLAFDSNGNLGSSTNVNWLQLTTATAAAAPSVPSAFTAAPGSSSTVNLSWGYSGAPLNGFEIDRSTDNQNFTTVVVLPASANSYTDINLLDQTTYYYRIRAYNGAGSSANTAVASATTPAATQPPPAPTGLTATPAGLASVGLSWTPPAHSILNYQIDRSSDGTNFTTITTSVAGSATSWNDPSVLSARTTYYYRIRAQNAYGISTSSAVASAATPELAGVTYALSVPFKKATHISGTVKQNTSANGKLMRIANIPYSRGLGTIAPSSLSFKLAGGFSQFLATIGLDDELANGSADFQLIADGTVIYDSGTLANGTSKGVNVNVQGVKLLTLTITGTGHADWANARLYA